MATSEPVEVPPSYATVFMTQYYTANFCTVAISGLIIYEHVITIVEEARNFWHGRLTGSRLLFFTNRYALLMFALFNLGGMAPSNTAVSLHPSICGGISVVINLSIFVLYFTEAVFAALRAFAISGYNWPLSLLVLSLGSITIWSNVYLIAKTTYYVETYGDAVACANTPDVSGESYYICLIVGAISSILSDALVLVITWWKTWRIKKAADHARMSTPLVTILLRDGSIYFAALAALNITQAVVQIYDGDIDYLSYFLTPLPAICISRFLFNLHSSSDLSQLATATTSDIDLTTLGTLHFTNRIAGNMGSMLGSNVSNSWVPELQGSGGQTEETEMTVIQA